MVGGISTGETAMLSGGSTAVADGAVTAAGSAQPRRFYGSVEIDSRREKSAAGSGWFEGSLQPSSSRNALRFAAAASTVGMDSDAGALMEIAR